MIPSSCSRIWDIDRWRSIYTLIVLCTIVKISSGYLINGNGIIRNTVINIPHRNSRDIYYTNKFILKEGTDIDGNLIENVEESQEAPEQGPKESSNKYSSDDIIVLEGLNAVRKRPGMYIGNTGERGVHQLLYEVLDNSVDEYLAGFCNRIKVTLMKDGSVQIEDNGRGIPCDISPKTGKSGLETVLTVLHSGGKFQDILSDYKLDKEGGETSKVNGTENQNVNEQEPNLEKQEKKIYEYSSGLHGVGLSVVNALSEFLIVDVYKGDRKYNMELSKGQITKQLTEEKLKMSNNKEKQKPKRYGTTIRFLPDYEQIFKSHHQHKSEDIEEGSESKRKGTCTGCTNGFLLELIKNRARELSYLNPGLFLTIVDQRIKTDKGPWEETYHNMGGTRSFLEDLVRDKQPLYRPISIITIKGTYNNINLEVSFSWSEESYTANIKAYANNVMTIAGTHIDGFKTSITRCVNGLLKKYGYFKGNVKPLNGEFIREGMTAVISVKLTGAEFDGQTKTKLGNAMVKTVTEKIVNEQFTSILENNRELLLAIHNKSQAAKRAFDAAKTAKELIRQKSSSLVSNISGKLTECSSGNSENNELFIVEGESAAGNAKQARNRQFQAVLPLKGKILNIEKIADNNKVLENQQIQLLINAIGININPMTWRQKQFQAQGGALYTGLEEEPLDFSDIKRMRYGKIILLTDADVDGSHLKALLLCLLYRLCPNLYLDGRVYVASPPMYRITNLKNKKYIYSWSQEHLMKVIQDLNENKDPEKPQVGDGSELEKRGEEEVDLKTELTSLLKINEPDHRRRGKHFEVSENEFDFNKRLNKHNRNYIIQRFKGLGEMMANQLWETTMDPKTRILKRIVVDHQHEMANAIKLLMGSDVQSRKEFIFNNSDAFQLEDLDI